MLLTCIDVRNHTRTPSPVDRKALRTGRRSMWWGGMNSEKGYQFRSATRARAGRGSPQTRMSQPPHIPLRLPHHLMCGFEGIRSRTLIHTVHTHGWRIRYDVFVPAASNPVRQCQPQAGTDANDGTRLPKYPMGTTAHDATDCCSKCTAEPDCVAWTFADGVHAGLTNCWPFSAVDGTKAQVSAPAFRLNTIMTRIVTRSSPFTHTFL